VTPKCELTSVELLNHEDVIQAFERYHKEYIVPFYLNIKEREEEAMKQAILE
jgi:hypothetical protein